MRRYYLVVTIKYPSLIEKIMKLNIRVLPRVAPENLDELRVIDSLSYGNKTPEIALQWAEKFPWAYILIQRKEQKGAWRTMGYGLVIPIDSIIFDGLIKGKLSEGDIKPKHVRLPNNAHALYIASIGTLLDDINTYESSRLVGAVAGQCLRVPIPVIGIAISEAGLRIGNEFGFKSSEYSSQAFQGIRGFKPKLLTKGKFKY